MTFTLQDIGTWDGQCLEELEKEGTLMYIKDSLCLAKTLMTKGPPRATLSMEYTDFPVFKQMF